jgi:asparagine synthase (glutamine-hydrolysing)
VLTGDGGDELFAGYEKYQTAGNSNVFISWLNQKFPRLFSVRELAACAPDPFQIRRFRSRAALFFLPSMQGAYSKNSWEGRHRYRLYSDELREALSHRFKSTNGALLESEASISNLNLMLYFDQNRYLPDDLLLKTDYSTMAFGLEARAPLLDHHLAGVAAGLPENLMVNANETKIALRRIAKRILPHELARRRKRGFGVPLKRWFRNELNDWILDLLIKTSVTVPKYFRRNTVKKLIEEHSTGRKNHTQRIFNLIVFELWYRHYLN